MNFVYTGDGRNNMANSLMIGAAMAGMNCTVLAPESLQPEEDLVETVMGLAEVSGSEIRITDNVKEAVAGADVIYTDVWASMGEEDKALNALPCSSPTR